jgi:hypothetical protein
MDILNWLYLAKNRFVRTSIDNPKDLMIFGAKVGANKRGDVYQNYAMEINDFAAVLPAGPTGPQGVAGNTGPQGPAGPIGPAGLTWRSTWVSGTSYILNDAVGYSGASYYCFSPTSGTTNPADDTTHWALLANVGATGAPGATGLQGPTGAAGPSNALSIGTVTTLSAGSSATATLTGSSPVQVLNLGIPQGAAGGAGAYQRYVALVSQSGVSNPTSVIKENTTSFPFPTWAYFTQGVYYINGLTTIDVNRIVIFVTKDANTAGYATAYWDGGTVILKTYNAAGALTNGLLNKASIELRIYPS